MGLPYITPDKLTKSYSTIGESGCSRCGELRTDGSGVFALFKLGDASILPASLVNKIYISAYSYPDITVRVDNSGKNNIGVIQSYADTITIGKYIWVCIRGLSPKKVTYFELGVAGVSVGDTMQSFGSGITTTGASTIYQYISLVAAAQFATTTEKVLIVRPGA